MPSYCIMGYSVGATAHKISWKEKERQVACCSCCYCLSLFPWGGEERKNQSSFEDAVHWLSFSPTLSCSMRCSLILLSLPKQKYYPEYYYSKGKSADDVSISTWRECDMTDSRLPVSHHLLLFSFRRMWEMMPTSNSSNKTVWEEILLSKVATEEHPTLLTNSSSLLLRLSWTKPVDTFHTFQSLNPCRRCITPITTVIRHLVIHMQCTIHITDHQLPTIHIIPWNPIHITTTTATTETWNPCLD